MRSTDDAFASFVSSTASDRKGFVKGEAVPLDRIFGSFLYAQSERLRGERCYYAFAKAPRRRRQDEIWYKGVAVRGCGTIFFREESRRQAEKLAPQGFDNLRNVH